MLAHYCVKPDEGLVRLCSVERLSVYAGQLTFNVRSKQVNEMAKTYSYAARDSKDSLKPFTFERRAPGADDVQIDILYCGVCHSDIHQARNEWGIAVYPLMPGYEIVGKVTAIGANVTAHKIGDLVGVGCMVDSCRHCDACQSDLEQYCLEGPTMTYATPDRVDGRNPMRSEARRVGNECRCRLAPDREKNR